MQFLKLLAINVAIFLALFTLSVLIGMLLQASSAQSAMNERYIYWAAAAGQIAVLIYLAFKRVADRTNYLIIAGLVLVAFVVLVGR